jgi:hypothetical protein
MLLHCYFNTVNETVLHLSISKGLDVKYLCYFNTVNETSLQLSISKGLDAKYLVLFYHR